MQTIPLDRMSTEMLIFYFEFLGAAFLRVKTASQTLTQYRPKLLLLRETMWPEIKSLVPEHQFKANLKKSRYEL